ncbi:MAG TPA: arginine deiminase-related protein, partial [Chitinophagaceae bacterium]|nr:arginine deiminase-related protein [Chitinophagaceae bacterium]
MQNTNHLLMIRPVHFGYNAATAVNNAFQVKNDDTDVQQKALEEFDNFVSLLLQKGVDVTVVEDTPEPHTPDSVFPNNWISFHEDGTVVLYPMFAENRRAERKQHVLDTIRKKFSQQSFTDLTPYEQSNLFLEGTGSMVLDRENKIAYACLSPRTSQKVLSDFGAKMGYRIVAFDAVDEKGFPIYHTNVMMCVADRYVVVCTDCIPDKGQRQLLTDALSATGKEIVPVSYVQVNQFAGNMLQVKTKTGAPLLIMSSQAWESLSGEQQQKLLGFNEVVHAPLYTIEK